MKVGDLVKMIDTAFTGIIMQADGKGVVRGTVRPDRVKVFWIEDGEASWEPKKWLEVINAASR